MSDPRRIATYDDTGKIPGDRLPVIPVDKLPAMPVQVVQGAEGPPGASAYQIAVANGFVGTEVEWEESLHGADAEPHAHPYAPDSHAIDGAYHTGTGVLPTAGQKNALAGTQGTPGDLNRYVTTQDVRLSDARPPTAHTHADGDLPAGLARDSEVTAAIAAHAATPHGGGAPVYAVLANGATDMALGTNTAVKVTPTANATWTTAVPAAGLTRTILVLTSGTTSRTITFGTGFRAVGTLATGTTSGRVFAISFLSDGSVLYETARTAAMVA